jgi:predicted O-methyltransferase YrrM
MKGGRKIEAREVASRIAELVEHPSTDEAAGRFLQEFVRRGGVRDVLELGFDRGVSTAYLAAALDDMGGGRVVTLDRPRSLSKRPNIEAVLGHVGVRDLVEPIVASSYNWTLMHLLERQKVATADGREAIEPCFDLCFIDGAHSWETDALAFALVDLLLRPDRWIIFDDLDWTYSSSPSLRDSESVSMMSAEQRTTAQIRKVVELLVSTRADYECHYVGRYALAYKRGDEHAHRRDLDEIVTAHEALIRELVIPASAPLRRRRRRDRARLQWARRPGSHGEG